MTIKSTIYRHLLNYKHVIKPKMFFYSNYKLDDRVVNMCMHAYTCVSYECITMCMFICSSY